MCGISALLNRHLTPDDSNADETGYISNTQYYGKLLNFLEESSLTGRREIRDAGIQRRFCPVQTWISSFLTLIGLCERKSSFSKINCKYILIDEVEDYYNTGQNIMCYCYEDCEDWRIAQDW